MSEPAPLPRMTSDEFVVWAMQQPEGKRYELVQGEVIGMAPERSVHALTKGRTYRLLAEAVEAAGLPCTVYPDGMAVVVDDDTIYEPDAMLRCGEELADETVKVFDPMVIVEVASPSTQPLDAGEKLADYFRIPSVRHYLVIRTKGRIVLPYARDEGGTITTRIIRDGTVELDPPGIIIGSLFG